ncbi:MAG: proton-conducting transporter membrane subunit, partial [Bacteroidota bacterium]
MTENAFFLLAAGLCLIPLIFLLPFNWKAPAGLLISLVFTVGSSMLAYEAFMHGTQRYIVPDVEPIGSFELRFDKLSVFFMSIVNLSVLAANVYALGYTRNVVHRYVSGLSSVFMCLLHVSMLFLCMVEQLMVFLIAWEIMSLSSFMLILWDHKREEVRDAALDYLVQMHIGVALLTTAVLLLQRDAGTATFDSLHIYFGQHNNLLLFSLFFLGFGFKAGFLGLHTWMPGTYSNAPAHAGAVMASAMKKLAIYGIIRVMLHVQDHQVLIGLSILILSISTTLYGIVNGIMQRNLARMLAYSSMENVGIIGIGLGMTMVGIGTHNNLLIVLGFTGCLFHILNHTLFK